MGKETGDSLGLAVRVGTGSPSKSGQAAVWGDHALSPMRKTMARLGGKGLHGARMIPSRACVVRSEKIGIKRSTAVHIFLRNQWSFEKAFSAQPLLSGSADRPCCLSNDVERRWEDGAQISVGFRACSSLGIPWLGTNLRARGNLLRGHKTSVFWAIDGRRNLPRSRLSGSEHFQDSLPGFRGKRRNSGAQGHSHAARRR